VNAADGVQTGWVKRPKKNLTLFAEGVMPRIRRLWADEGWEHRWWPQGARQDVATMPVGSAGTSS
jgi:hypothetical protein